MLGLCFLRDSALVAITKGDKTTMKKTHNWFLAGVLVAGLDAGAASFYVDIDWTGTETGDPTTPFSTIGAAMLRRRQRA